MNKKQEWLTTAVSLKEISWTWETHCCCDSVGELMNNEHERLTTAVILKENSCTLNMRDSLQLWFFRRTHEHERLSKAVNLKESSWKCEYLDFPVPISLLLFIMISLHPSFMISFPVFSLMFTSWSIFHFLFCCLLDIPFWSLFHFMIWFFSTSCSDFFSSSCSDFFSSFYSELFFLS